MRKCAVSKRTCKMFLYVCLFCLLFTSIGMNVIPVMAETESLPKISEYDKEYYDRFRGKGIELNVYNWGEYLSDGSDEGMDVNAEFQRITGIKVNYSNYETNEGMYAKMKSGANSYDVIFPSDYMVSRLIDENMIQPLDFKNIPNFKYIGESFLKPNYDSQNLYSVPYVWGRVSIIYNKKLLGHEVSSIDELWNPENEGKILMFKNSRDAFAIALEKLGYDMNTEKESELREAAELLKQQKTLVQAYVMDQIFDKMQGNEAAIAPYYIGDYYIMKEVNPDLEVFIPERTNIYYDALCIPSDSKQKEAAEMYINFLNEPEVAAANAEFTMYSTANMGAWELLDDDIKNDTNLYPSAEELKNSQSFVNLSEDTNLLLDQLWTDILSDDAGYLDWVMPVFVVFSISVLLFNSIRKKRKKSNMQ